MMKPTDTLYIPIQFRDALALVDTSTSSCGFILLGSQTKFRDETRNRIADQIKHAICIATASDDMGEVAERVSLHAQRSAAGKKAAKTRAKKKR